MTEGEIGCSRAACQLHKRRNVKEHLPERLQGQMDTRIKAAYNMAEYKAAKAELQSVVGQLEKINPSAARSLQEGLEETLSLHRLGVPERLRTRLSSTNTIESALSRVDHVISRVKRWRGGDHVQRWTATALPEAQKKFPEVRGHKELPALLEKLNPSKQEKIA